VPSALPALKGLLDFESTCGLDWPSYDLLVGIGMSLVSGGMPEPACR